MQCLLLSHLTLSFFPVEWQALSLPYISHFVLSVYCNVLIVTVAVHLTFFPFIAIFLIVASFFFLPNSMFNCCLISHIFFVQCNVYLLCRTYIYCFFPSNAMLNRFCSIHISFSLSSAKFCCCCTSHISLFPFNAMLNCCRSIHISFSRLLAKLILLMGWLFTVLYNAGTP